MTESNFAAKELNFFGKNSILYAFTPCCERPYATHLGNV